MAQEGAMSVKAMITSALTDFLKNQAGDMIKEIVHKELKEGSILCSHFFVCLFFMMMCPHYIRETCKQVQKQIAPSSKCARPHPRRRSNWFDMFCL